MPLRTCTLAATFAALALLATGCSLGIVRPAQVTAAAATPPSEQDIQHCRGLRNDFDIFGGFSVASAFLTGGAGLSTIAIPGDSDGTGGTSPSAGQFVMGFTTLAVGTIGAVFTFLMEQRGKQYGDDDCARTLSGRD